jgi:hypothetical protein
MSLRTELAKNTQTSPKNNLDSRLISMTYPKRFWNTADQQASQTTRRAERGNRSADPAPTRSSINLHSYTTPRNNPTPGKLKPAAPGDHRIIETVRAGTTPARGPFQARAAKPEPVLNPTPAKGPGIARSARPRGEGERTEGRSPDPGAAPPRRSPPAPDIPRALPLRRGVGFREAGGGGECGVRGSRETGLGFKYADAACGNGGGRTAAECFVPLPGVASPHLSVGLKYMGPIC